MTKNHSVWQLLKTRFKGLPIWHQFICRAAVKKSSLNADDLEKAYEIFLAEKKLSNGQVLPKLIIDDVIPVQLVGTSQGITLTELKKLENINAIPHTASLPFCEGLTIIYGRNGAGKSGYARVLKAACFSRAGKIVIEPDIRKADAHTKAQKAHIHIKDQVQPIVFEPSKATDTSLQRIAFFDSEAAGKHVAGTNAIEFIPAGLDVLDEEIRCFNLLKARLEKEVTAKDTSNPFKERFEGTSTIRTKIESLSAESDIEELKKLAVFEDTEVTQLTALTEEHKTLSSNEKVFRDLKNTNLPQLIAFIEKIKTLAESFGAAKTAELKTLLTEAETKRKKAAELQGKLSIDLTALEKEWREFLSSGKVLAQKINSNYPTKHDDCLFCGRTLDTPEAVTRIKNFWEFLQGKANQEYEAAAALIAAKIRALKALKLDIFGTSEIVRSFLTVQDMPLVSEIDAYLSALTLQRDAAVQYLKQETPSLADNLNKAVSPVVKLTDLQKTLQDKITLAEKEGLPALLAATAAKLRELQHREILKGIIAKVETYLKDLKWVKLATAAFEEFNTKGLNTKKTKIMKEFLEGNYVDLFNAELKDLGFDHLKIVVGTTSRGNQNTAKFFKIQGHVQEYDPHKILSEGEQKALALADFLAGLKFNPQFCGAIFDDPVTSLDHDIRKKVAHRLALESKKRQIVVFTHDLVFLNDLLVAVERESLEDAHLTHWVERTNDNPGHITVGTCPITAQKYNNPQLARQHIVEAFKATGATRANGIITGMSYLRKTVEDMIIYKLLEGTVKRWEDRILYSKIADIRWPDETLITDIVLTYEEISKHEGGHAVSEESQIAPPSEKELLELCAKVEKFISTISTLKKQKKVAA